MVLKMRSDAPASLGDTDIGNVEATQSGPWSPRRCKERHHLYIVAAEHISAIKVVVLPRCLAPTTMMLLRSVSTAYHLLGFFGMSTSHREHQPRVLTVVDMPGLPRYAATSLSTGSGSFQRRQPRPAWRSCGTLHS